MLSPRWSTSPARCNVMSCHVTYSDNLLCASFTYNNPLKMQHIFLQSIPPPGLPPVPHWHDFLFVMIFIAELSVYLESWPGEQPPPLVSVLTAEYSSPTIIILLYIIWCWIVGIWFWRLIISYFHWDWDIAHAVPTYATKHGNIFLTSSPTIINYLKKMFKL